MDKKDILMVVVIAAVVGFLSASLGAQVGMSPRGGGGFGQAPNSSQIAAHSCDGDGICEGKAFKGDFISGSWGQIQRYPASYGDGLLMRSEHNEPIHFRTPGGENPVGFNDITIDVDGELIVRNLEGNGTGYVCVERDGTFFRSNSSCN